MSAVITTLNTPSTTTAATDTTTRRHPVRRAAVVFGAVAAVAVTAVAAVASAADVPLAIDGESIPIAGFAQMTLLGAVLGGLLAAAFSRFASRPRRTFTVVAMVLTALSCVPSVALPQDATTKIVLVATHVVAALIIVPALARQLRR